MEAGSFSLTVPLAKTATTGEDADDKLHGSHDHFPRSISMEAGSSSSTTPLPKTGATGEDADDRVNSKKLQLEDHGSHDGHEIMMVRNLDDRRNNRLTDPTKAVQTDFEGDATGDANSDAGQEGDDHPIDQNAGEGEEGGRDGDENAEDANGNTGQQGDNNANNENADLLIERLNDAEEPEETDVGPPGVPLIVGGWADPKRHAKVVELCPPLPY